MLELRERRRVTVTDVAAFIVILTLAIGSPYTPFVSLRLGELTCFAVLALYLLWRRERS